MSLQSDIKDGAKDTIQSITGTPADQLRGLSPEAMLQDFATRRLAAPPQAAARTPTEAIVTSTVLPNTSVLVPVDTAPSIPGVGGTTGNSMTVLAAQDSGGGVIVAATIDVLIV